MALYEIVENGKYGYIDGSGNVAIEPVYERTYTFPIIHKERIYPVIDRDKIGFVNLETRKFYQPFFEKKLLLKKTAWGDYYFTGGMGKIVVSERWGYINKNADIVIDPQFTFCGDFSEEIACVQIDNKLGFINQTGEIIISPRFEFNFERDFGEYNYNLPLFRDGLARLKVGNQWGFINKDGELAISPCFDWCGHFGEGLAAVRTGNKMGFIGKDGEIAIRPNFAWEWNEFCGGLAVASLEVVPYEKRYGFIATNGRWAISPEYHTVRAFSEGLAAVCTEWRWNDPAKLEYTIEEWGYIDKGGSMNISSQFRDAKSFVEGLAAVRVGLKWGYINKIGELVIPPRFFTGTDESNYIGGANDFYHGIAAVRIGQNMGYIDITGNYIWNPSR